MGKVFTSGWTEQRFRKNQNQALRGVRHLRNLLRVFCKSPVPWKLQNDLGLSANYDVECLSKMLLTTCAYWRIFLPTFESFCEYSADG